MWWIAACLGALLWLLAVRIRLNDKQRQAKRELDARQRRIDLAKEGGLIPDVADSEALAKQRSEFVSEAFGPAAAHYLDEELTVASLMLLVAYFELEDRAPEVHCEVLPCLDSNPQWPDAAARSPIVRQDAGQLVLEPPQKHWELLTGMEARLHLLTAFAPVLRPVPASEPLVRAYRPYAVARRSVAGASPVVTIIGEADRTTATTEATQGA